MPTIIAGAMRFTMLQSTAPRAWCARTLAKLVNTMTASDVPSARCWT